MTSSTINNYLYVLIAVKTRFTQTQQRHINYQYPSPTPQVLEHVLVASCPRAAYKLGFKCFLESEQAMEWSKAAAFCSQLGGNLAVIDSAEEMTALKRMAPQLH